MKNCSPVSGKALTFVSVALLFSLGVALLAPTSPVRAIEERSESTNLDYAKALSKAFRETSQTVLPAVVSIQTTSQIKRSSRGFPRIPDSFFDDFFRRHRYGPHYRNQSFTPSSPRHGVGSGVIIDASGLILTNNHVVEGSDKVKVTLSDGREFEATDIRRDPNTDLAVLRIENVTGLTAAKMGNSDRVEIGDWVLALGQPFGLEGTVTAGIVSAKGRGIDLATTENFIQTDAAINPGNSGGPLVNLSGEIVGINTAISTNSGGNQGIGFAIPVNLARWVSDQLIASGEVKRSYLGVRIQPVTHELAKQFDVDSTKGALVTSVLDDSPAKRAGVQPGDIITRFGEKAVASPRELQVIVQQVEPGSEQPVTVLRDGKEQQLVAVCGAMPGELNEKSLELDAQPASELGFEVGELAGDVAERLGVSTDEGVVVTRVLRGSPASEENLRTGDVITEVNRVPVTNLSEFRAAMKKGDDGGALLLVRSQGGSRFVVLKAE